jgi:hypothetical protein
MERHAEDWRGREERDETSQRVIAADIKILADIPVFCEPGPSALTEKSRAEETTIWFAPKRPATSLKT